MSGTAGSAAAGDGHPAPAAGPAGAVSPAGPVVQDHDLRAVLAIRPFRSLWLCLGLSSFGDWLGLLATTAMALSLGGALGGSPSGGSSYAAGNFAVSGVLILRLAPAIVLGPLAGAVADRWDRRTTMVVGDLLRGALFVSIPLVGTLWWLFAATLAIEVVALFWGPAKDASVPNLVPRERLEAANQLGLAVTYGTAPLAALVFSGLALISGGFGALLDEVGGRNDLALFVNAATYFVAAATIARLRIPGGARGTGGEVPGVLRQVLDGWRFVATTRTVRGLVVGMLGAFGAGGFVIGVAPSFARDLDAGEPAYGVLFAAVFTGLALGMWTGPRVLSTLARWRLFSLSLVAAGVALLALALIGNIVIVAGLAVVVGACGGVAWVTGYTMLGLEVADEVRGRTFAFVQSAARVVLVAVMALAPALAAVFGRHRFDVTGTAGVDYNGAALTLAVGALLAIGIGVLAHRQLDDGSPRPLLRDILALVPHHRPADGAADRRHPGLLIAVEGGDGAGKSTQVQLLAQWLTARGHDVLTTREPGGTSLGRRVREVVLHGEAVSPRAEALLYAADRAQHVEQVLLPALRCGQVVVTDRYVDSSLAYQGAGRSLDVAELAALSAFATRGLVPDVTVLLDVDPAAARERAPRLRTAPDRLEREPAAFHAAVRQRFLDLAAAHPRRYLVLDAGAGADEVAARVREHLATRLPAAAVASVRHVPGAP